MRAKRWISAVLALLLLLSLAACGGGDDSSGSGGDDPSQASLPEPEPDPEYPVRVRAVAVDARPGKVVSLAPSITEKICDLGLESRLSGRSSVQDAYPASIRSLPQYGTPQLPDMDALRELAPQLILSVEELPGDMMAELEAMGATLVVVPSYCGTLAELEELYITLATVLEGRTTGRAIGERFVSLLEERLNEIAAAYPEDYPLNALYLRLMPYKIATGDTLEGELLERVGFLNMAADQKTFWDYDSDFANTTDGKAAFAAVEIIFMDGIKVTIKDLEQSAFYKGLQATLKDWYIYIDAGAFEVQSMRMLDELEKMVSLETVGER